MNDSREQLKDLIAKIDAVMVEAKPNIVIALNALCLMGASLAVRLGVPKDAYLEDIGKIYDDQNNAPKETVDEQA